VVRARDEAVAKDVEPDLDKYFKDFVIGGPGAFMVVAKDFESFADGILARLGLVPRSLIGGVVHGFLVR
jgi:hypothetical protein